MKIDDIEDKKLEQSVFLVGNVVSPDDFYSCHQLKIRGAGNLKTETQCQNIPRSLSTEAFEVLTASVFWQIF